jgi:hypothetical protein
MKAVIAVSVLGVLSMAASGTTAGAGCAFGPQKLPGSIPPGAYDDSRSYTSGGGRIRVTIETINGHQLSVAFPGYCDRQVGSNITCSTWASPDASIAPEIVNPNSVTVPYWFICND